MLISLKDIGKIFGSLSEFQKGIAFGGRNCGKRSRRKSMAAVIPVSTSPLPAVLSSNEVFAVTAQIVVAEGVDEPEVTFVPVVKSLEYKEAGFFMSPANYYITFENGTDTDAKKVLADYLDAVKSVTVGDVTYTKALLGLGYNNNEFAASVVEQLLGFDVLK